MIAIVAMPPPAAAGLRVGCREGLEFGRIGLGPGLRRASGFAWSRSWLAKMMTAMPAVKPTVTGQGMY